MSESKKPTMPKVKGMEDMPSDAELEALQAEIDKAKRGAGSRADAIKADMDKVNLSEEEIKAKLEEAGINADAPDAGAAAVARIQELEAELANLKDQALRAMADAENVKKRAEREVSAAKMFGIEKFAQDILSVHDNLSRALLTLEGTNKADLGENAKNLVDGIELTEKDLIMVLSRHGVKAVAGVGSKFDPNVHQAVANIPSDEDKGNVANVMQTGFKIGDRTLRAAMVAVSTGPAKT